VPGAEDGSAIRILQAFGLAAKFSDFDTLPGRVDGFDRLKPNERATEDASLRAVFSHRSDTLEALELADSLLDACPSVVGYFCEERTSVG
jgi:hypothetical protein